MYAHDMDCAISSHNYDMVRDDMDDTNNNMEHSNNDMVYANNMNNVDSNHIRMNANNNRNNNDYNHTDNTLLTRMVRQYGMKHPMLDRKRTLNDENNNSHLHKNLQN